MNAIQRTLTRRSTAVKEDNDRYERIYSIALMMVMMMIVILRERDTKDIDKETNSGQGGDKETGEKPLEQVEARV